MSLFQRSRKPTDVLEDLIYIKKWDEASRRCRSHPQDARGKGYHGRLPIHHACWKQAPLSLIRQLHEAYDEGVRTSNDNGSLPLHRACARALLEVIEYLHDLYNEGATKRNDFELIPVDMLNKNENLSEEDKAKARAILSSPPGARMTTPLRPTKPRTATAATTSANVSNNTTTPSMTTSSGAADSHGSPLSPNTSKRPSTPSPDGLDANDVLNHGRDDERRKAAAAAEAASAAHARARVGAARLEKEEAGRSWGMDHLVGSMSRKGQSLADVARGNVPKTDDAARVAMERKKRAHDNAFGEDRDRLKPFLELGANVSKSSVELSVEYIRSCTQDFSDELKLGEGAFGIVYRGYDDVLQRRFAVKRIKYDVLAVSDDEEVRSTRSMLEKELKVLNNFQHEHIARLYGYFLTEDLCNEQLLVYELASRGSLDSFFEIEAKRSELSWQRRILVSLHVASALKFLHEGGGSTENTCLHRDVKAANICLRADYSAVLIDCGLAKMIPKEDSRAHGWSSSKTAGGQPGTIEYMCPQYAAGLAASDRTDVFAFGIVMLEIFTGSLQQSKPNGFYDRYISDAAGGPGDESLVSSDIDEAAGTWEDDAGEKYSQLALKCIRTKPNDRPTMREVFSRIGHIAQTHCFLKPEEVEDIDCGKQAKTLTSSTVMDIIRSRRWQEVSTCVLQIDDRDFDRLFFFACRWGPSIAAVQSFLQVDDEISHKLNRNHEHPIHILCCFGAEKEVIETLVGLHHRALNVQSYATGETPLGLAQTREWKYYKDNQADVISFLRRTSFAQHFDGMTGLPKQPGFKLWAGIQPPGLTNANATLLYIDIAGFKAVNDNASHDEGDDIIKKYARDISGVCDAHASAMRSDVCVACEVYRMGGDEFAVVCKFIGNTRNMWKYALKQLATSLSDLNYVDEQEPPRYSTFLRIGCAAGSLSNIGNVLNEADGLQAEVKRQIDLQRGACIPLSEIRQRGKSNLSDLFIV